MAETKQQDLIGRFADLSEGALQRLSEAPGADRAVQAFKGLADKVDELQRRTRGFRQSFAYGEEPAGEEDLTARTR